MRTPNTPKLALDFIEALQSPSKRLSYWEHNFVAHMAELIEEGHKLTDPQFYKLEEIYAQKTD